MFFTCITSVFNTFQESTLSFGKPHFFTSFRHMVLLTIYSCSLVYPSALVNRCLSIHSSPFTTLNIMIKSSIFPLTHKLRILYFSDSLHKAPPSNLVTFLWPLFFVSSLAYVFLFKCSDHTTVVHSCPGHIMDITNSLSTSSSMYLKGTLMFIKNFYNSLMILWICFADDTWFCVMTPASFSSFYLTSCLCSHLGLLVLFRHF